MATPPRPSWDLAMGLGMEKPKAVAGCLLAGYREWTIKGFKGQDPKFTTIDPDMERADQLIEDDSAARFDELVGRVSHISKDKLDKSHMPVTDHEKLIRYRAVRTAAIVAEMKRRGVEVTEMNAVHLAAILCAAVPTDPAFLLPYHVAFVLEESIESGAIALPMDSSTEPRRNVGWRPESLAGVENGSPADCLGKGGRGITLCIVGMR